MLVLGREAAEYRTNLNGDTSYVFTLIFMHPPLSPCMRLPGAVAVQWKQASSSVILGRVALAQGQDYSGLLGGVLSVSLLLLLLLATFAWMRKKKRIEGE